MSTVGCQKQGVLLTKATLTYFVPGIIVLAAYAKIFFIVRRHRRAVRPSLLHVTTTGPRSSTTSPHHDWTTTGPRSSVTSPHHDWTAATLLQHLWL